jgi:hypothetical protein
MKTFQLVLNFSDLDELKTFIDDIESIELSKLKKIIKKTGTDKRGGKTKDLHQKAKEYQNEHPGITYKESLKFVGLQIREDKQNKNKENDTEEEVIGCISKENALKILEEKKKELTFNKAI